MTETTYSFRNLVLWQKAQALTLEIIRLAAQLPRDGVAPIMGSQAVRSASSIAANIAEGHGRFSLGAHSNHLSIAKGSACETDGWLDLLRRADYMDAETEQRLHSACEEIVRMLTAKILTFDREIKKRTSKIREDRESYLAGAASPNDDEGF